MGDLVRQMGNLTENDLDMIEEHLEHWLQDKSNGATVRMTVKLTGLPEKGKKAWIPRGFGQIAVNGPTLVLHLISMLRRERKQAAERGATDAPAADQPPTLENTDDRADRA